MLCRSVLVAAGMAALCLVMGLPQSHRQEPVCPSQHSCSSRSTSEAYSRLECSCDASCRTHGDCCRDSQYYDEAEQMKGASEYVCADLDPCWGLTRYMKYKCSEGWDNTEVQELCLKGIQSGHFNLFPVTSTTTSTTYVNQYCALCNGEDTASLRMWNAQVECLNVPISHIAKDYSVGFHEGQWGIIEPSLGLSSFEPCNFRFEIPTDIKNYTTWCEPSVKTCGNEGAKQRDRILCLSYSAPVYRGYVRYRNQHCASCNGIKEHTCVETVFSQCPAVFGIFSMLFDVVDRCGSKSVGFSCCSPEEIWDSSSEKCRKVFCPNPNEKYLIDKCVPA